MVAIPGTGTSSFGTSRFWITNNQLTLPRPGFAARVQKDPIPYSNDSTLQIGGGDDDDLTIDVVMNSGDWDAFAAQRWTAGKTLTLLGDGPRPAVLTKAGSPKFYAEGAVIASVTFTFY